MIKVIVDKLQPIKAVEFQANSIELNINRIYVILYVAALLFLSSVYFTTLKVQT